MNVHIFIPCFVDQLYPETGFNMVKILEKFGCTVHYPEQQTCCGQPAFNAGFQDEAKIVGQKFIKDFIDSDYIVVPSASCTGFIRNYYPQLFDNSSIHNEVKDVSNKIFEFSEFLIDILKVEDTGATFSAIAAYHYSCSGLRECHLDEKPRKLLSKVRNLIVQDIKDKETCCGFGGTFAVKYNDISIAMAEQKVENCIETGADYIISTDLSCLMHLQGYIDKKGYSIKTIHLADVLANGL